MGKERVGDREGEGERRKGRERSDGKREVG